MSRELRRVALDFKWPMNKVWEGYINPYEDKPAACTACEGQGTSRIYRFLHNCWYGQVPFKPEDRGSTPYTPETPHVRRLAEHNCQGNPDFYGNEERDIQAEARRLCKLFNERWCHHLHQKDVNVLLRADRLWDFTRRPITAYQRAYVKRRMRTGRCNSWLPFNNGYRPTAREVNLWSLIGFGHDSYNCALVVAAKCRRLKLPTECPECHGEGWLWTDPEEKRLYEEWKPQEPSEGPGYQVWETTTEGSPITPVYENPAMLAEWLADHRPQEGDAAQWYKFIMEDKWCPSGAMDTGSGQILTGARIAELPAPPQPEMSLLDEAALLCLPLTLNKPRMRKMVRQRRKRQMLAEAALEAEDE